MVYSWIMLWWSPYSINSIFLPWNRLYSMKCMPSIRMSHCEKVMFMWLKWILISLPWEDRIHVDNASFEGSFSWDVHVTSVSNGESYRDEVHIHVNSVCYNESYRDEVHIPWNFGGYILSLSSFVMAGHFMLVSKDGKSSNVPTTEHATIKNHTVNIRALRL